MGVDLAWRVPPKKPSAAVVLDKRCKIVEREFPVTDDDITSFAEPYAGDSCIIGIDAPLVVANESGARPCEVELLREYRIPAFPASKWWLGRAFGGARGEKLVAKLKKLGIELSDSITPRAKPRVAMEVYPRASITALLGRVPQYKKGNRLERAEGIMEISHRLARAEPPLELDIDASSPMAHDLLDADVSAYTVYLYWKFGENRCEVIGDTKTGFILVPRPSA